MCLLLARLVRAIVRDRVMPTVEAPMPLRQSIDAGLNYAGVIIAVLVGIGALGIDFTNLAIVLGALSVGIGLGLQNIANNIISGVILLIERPIKAGDWVSVTGHEGFVRRINIRATEIETFQRTHVHRAQQRVPAEPGDQPHLFRHVEPHRHPAHRRARHRRREARDDPARSRRSTSRACCACRSRSCASPRIAPGGLDFELFVFVAKLEDRLIVTNDLNRTILARLIEEKIVDPKAVHGIQAARPRPAGRGAARSTTRPTMPPRRRRAEDQRLSRWRHLPLVLLFVLGALSGVALWAYAPDLPRDYLIERYGQPPSSFIDVGGTRAHVRDEGKADAMPLRADPRLAGLAAHVGGLGAPSSGTATA